MTIREKLEAELAACNSAGGCPYPSATAQTNFSPLPRGETFFAAPLPKVSATQQELSPSACAYRTNFSPQYPALAQIIRLFADDCHVIAHARKLAVLRHKRRACRTRAGRFPK